MLLNQRPETLSLEEFVVRVKGAVKGANVREEILEAVRLFLKTYGIEFREKKA